MITSYDRFGSGLRHRKSGCSGRYAPGRTEPLSTVVIERPPPAGGERETVSPRWTLADSATKYTAPVRTVRSPMYTVKARGERQEVCAHCFFRPSGWVYELAVRAGVR